MKCIMRVILTARSSILPIYEAILEKLIGVLGIMARNPNNPNFGQYLFECVGAVVRFVVGESGSSSAGGERVKRVEEFERVLFGPFTYILQQDVEGEDNAAYG